MTFLLPKIYFVLARSVDPDEIPQYVAFHWDLLFVSKNHLWVFSLLKVENCGISPCHMGTASQASFLYHLDS